MEWVTSPACRWGPAAQPARPNAVAIPPPCTAWLRGWRKTGDWAVPTRVRPASEAAGRQAAWHRVAPLRPVPRVPRPEPNRANRPAVKARGRLRASVLGAARQAAARAARRPWASPAVWAQRRARAVAVRARAAAVAWPAVPERARRAPPSRAPKGGVAAAAW